MMTGLYAARNVLGERHDLWSINTEAEYQEEQSSDGAQTYRPKYAEPSRIDGVEKRETPEVPKSLISD